MNVITSVLMLCLEGNVVCERNLTKPQLKFYEPGKACYIEGVFYQSCPKMEYQK